MKNVTKNYKLNPMGDNDIKTLLVETKNGVGYCYKFLINEPKNFTALIRQKIIQPWLQEMMMQPLVGDYRLPEPPGEEEPIKPKTFRQFLKGREKERTQAFKRGK